MNQNRSPLKRAIARVAGLFAGLAFASTAFAHVFPQKQEPGAGASVAAPSQVKITFDGPLEPAFSSLTITNAVARQVNAEKSLVDAHQPDVMTVALPPLRARELYRALGGSRIRRASHPWRLRVRSKVSVGGIAA
jgi:methionine-rich copper-binding protein CopC